MNLVHDKTLMVRCDFYFQGIDFLRFQLGLGRSVRAPHSGWAGGPTSPAAHDLLYLHAHPLQQVITARSWAQPSQLSTKRLWSVLTNTSGYPSA